MPRGGHAASGPPPDPNALRRDRKSDAATWTALPPEGRQAAPPTWPLLGQTPREDELWFDLWSRPQAVAWERLGQTYEVALFVRNLARAEEPRASVELQKVVRQYLDSLGLSTQGMLRNRWRIAAAPTSVPDEPSERTRPPKRPSSRDRLKIVREDDDGDS